MPSRETESRSFERGKEMGGWRRDRSQDSNCYPLLTSHGVLFISPRWTCPLVGHPPLFELPDLLPANLFGPSALFILVLVG